MTPLNEVSGWALTNPSAHEFYAESRTNARLSHIRSSSEDALSADGSPSFQAVLIEVLSETDWIFTSKAGEAKAGAIQIDCS